MPLTVRDKNHYPDCLYVSLFPSIKFLNNCLNSGNSLVPEKSRYLNACFIIRYSVSSQNLQNFSVYFKAKVAVKYTSGDCFFIVHIWTDLMQNICKQFFKEQQNILF